MFQNYTLVEQNLQNLYSKKLKYNPNVAFWSLPEGPPVAVTETVDGINNSLLIHINYQYLPDLEVTKNLPFDDSELGKPSGSITINVPAHEQVCVFAL